MNQVELLDELDVDFEANKHSIRAREMPSEQETKDLISSALNKAILDKLATNEDLDIKGIREAVIQVFNEVMTPYYSVKSVLNSNKTVTLFVEGYETFDIEKLKELADDRS